jgi:hypothetical protein
VSELTIGAVRTEDGGIYTCFARNEFGHDQTAMHLLVQGIFQKSIFQSFLRTLTCSMMNAACKSAHLVTVDPTDKFGQMVLVMHVIFM